MQRMRIALIKGVVCLLLGQLGTLIVWGQARTIAKLEFKMTEIAASNDRRQVEMARMKVPENRTKPTSNLIELTVVRLKSKAANPGPPIAYLSGGPGGSAISDMWLPEVDDLFSKLQQTNDVILLDQRGTGRSVPRVLWLAPTSLPPDAFLSQEKMAGYFRQASAQALADFKQRGIDLSGYNSVESADDLNDLRLALGAEKLSLIGFSYGTHLALATIRRHAAHLDSVVLLGTEGPNHSVKLPSTYDAQLRKLSDLAAQDPNVGSKVPDMVALLQKIFARLEKEPLTVRVQNQRTRQPVDVIVGKFGLQLLLRLDVGDGNDFVEFPALFYSLDKGDTSLLAKYVEKRYNQLGRGVSGMAMMMDLFSGVTAERLAQVKKETPTALLGEAVNFPDLDTEPWGNPDLGDAYRAALLTNTRTLFISGTLDSNTPPYQAEEVRWGFSNASHLIVEYAGHEDTLPNEAVRAAILDFLRGKEVSGVRISLGRPKFVPIR